MASSSQIPFGPLGDTITFAAATPTPPTALQAPVDPTTNTSAGQYRIINDSTVTVFLGVGKTSAAAISNAGAVATSIPLLPGTDEVCASALTHFLRVKLPAELQRFTSRRGKVYSVIADNELLSRVIEHEGFESVAYPDPLSGKEPYTFGHGLTYITKDESIVILKSRLVQIGYDLEKCIRGQRI